MIDLSSGVTLIKQVYDLVSVIKTARDKRLVDEAVGELQQKIAELQMFNARLADCYSAERAHNRELMDKLNQLEDFEAKRVNYAHHTTAAGSLVLVEKPSAETKEPPVYICACCFGDRVISFLQPKPDILFYGGYYIHYCPRCNNVYSTDAVPPIQDN
ncbi:hypothetical protein CUL37_09130 [Salmonella enterica]|nr:hypothetical protein [Salmonella enterica]EBT8719666.1 hypothetical protein [Salmonella enterica]EDO1913495.1 hypothetical protein [Salmonella enterica]ELO0596686.1 hypothetical protein [Salmonella enterica]